MNYDLDRITCPHCGHEYEYSHAAIENPGHLYWRQETCERCERSFEWTATVSFRCAKVEP